MAAATFYVEIKPDTNADGTRSVRIRITKDRKKAYLNLGIKLKVEGNQRKSEWNPEPDYRKDNWVTSRHPRASTLNAEIRLALDGLSEVAKKHPTYSASEIKQEYEKPAQGLEELAPPRGLFAYIDDRVARKRKLGQFGAADNIYYAAKALRAYAKKKTDREILTPSFLTDFAAHLVANYSAATASKYLSYLATSYRKGVLSGRVDQMGDPFEDIHIRVTRKKQPRPLASQLLDLYALELESKAWQDARNTLILLFLLHGARVSEGLLLEWDKHVHEDYISYMPRKRGAKLKHVPRSEMINQILSHYPRQGRYVLPYLTDEDGKKSEEEMFVLLKSITSRINKALRRMAKEHGLAHLSTHMARRSFTDRALEELQDLHKVKELVGHTSVTTTEHYADEMQRDKLTDASRRIFGQLALPRGTGAPVAEAGEQQGNNND